MASALQLSVDRTIHILGFPKSTVLRKIKGADVLDSDQSERLFQLQRLIGMVQQMVQDYGDPQGFDAGQWLGQWLEQANPALGGEKPAAYLDTASGVALVESLLHRMISGAYARGRGPTGFGLAHCHPGPGLESHRPGRQRHGHPRRRWNRPRAHGTAPAPSRWPAWRPWCT
jgi:uncharacterized protein (DUF2384 family)